jgi:predicted dehydrogenase
VSLKIGCIGAGGIAVPHLKAYVRSPHVQEVLLADPSEAARSGMAAQFGIIKGVCADYHELLEDPSIQVIDICTPHYLHKPQAIEAMQAGKDVITEKPLALNVEECDAMMAVSRETGRRLFCALCQRRFPAHLKARELMAAGEIGRPFLGIINIIGDEFERMNDPASWKGDWDLAGGGALFDTGYHAVYMLQHFFGPARAVTAMTKRLIVEPENKSDDTSVVALEMDGGAVCSIVVTYAATGDRWSEERRIVGTGGSLLMRDNPEDEMPLVILHGGDFGSVPVHNPPGVNHYAIGQAVEYFLDCILTGAESDITLAEARAAVATVQAAYQSEREGRRVAIQSL